MLVTGLFMNTHNYLLNAMRKERGKITMHIMTYFSKSSVAIIN